MKKTNIFIFFLLMTFQIAWAQFFGKNKVQYTDFQWLFLQSEHFDIYFTAGGRDAATFVAQVAEESYQSLRNSFRYDLSDRIKIIVYNSHNDFQQTNVSTSPPEESVGGFTEFFKNRVVIPYEGEWEKFRHVVHHELTHAVMLQMVYGAGVQSIITGITQMQLPLWFIEGLAEYESRGWDIESDMYIRDAALNGYLPEIPYLYGFLAYKGGQSVLNYVADRYGEEKIGELLGKIKINKSFERGLKQSVGMDMEEFSKKWHRYVKRRYWPDIADREEPEEFAKRVTFHIKDNRYVNFVNISPAMSNRGDKIAFISDRDDYFDIYIASAIDGKILKKLVRGQRAGDLEQLNWLKGPGITWSPDDKYIAFSAKSGATDELHIVDSRTGGIEKSYSFDLDGVYNPHWNPKSDKIVFAGVYHSNSDLYIYDLDKGTLDKLTNDFFSDVEAKWSPDGEKIIFASDRGAFVDEIPQYMKPKDIDMKNYDIYEINGDGTGLRRLVASNFLERTPTYSPDQKYIAFISDRAGVCNVYLKDLESQEEWPITNVITGVFQPSWGGDGNRMAFTAFYYAGYDIYLLKNPLSIKPGDVTVKETQFVKSLQAPIDNVAEEEAGESSGQPDKETQKYRNFIFDESFAAGEIKEEGESVFLDSSEYALPTGEFIVHDYKIKFTPDFVYGSVGYSQFFGTQGYANFLFSDVLGNHQINIAANLFGDLRNADYAFTYLYLPKRIDLGTGFYHNAYYFYSDYTGWVRDRNYGLSIYASNPFSRYRRLSLTFTAMGINRSYLDLPDDYVEWASQQGYFSPRDRYFMLTNVSYTKDNTIWGYTGPSNGSRYGVGITNSPGLGKNGIDFTTLRGDWRKYLRIKSDYVFGLRASGGMSMGKHPQKFFLGGLPNWINYKYSGAGIRVRHIEEIYFASWEMPLRGAGYYTLEGTRFLMSNVEFRFPLLRRLTMGFPLPIDLYDVGGVLFSDMGFAWDEGDDVKPFAKSPNGLIRTKDAFASIGFGARIFLGYFLIRLDLAWETDFYRTTSSPQILWSLGADF
ncbi:PD40 domain-containing protein [candidate division KSB1 bacterium]|nr:PD40 domain-containing protein [candidate division KSB1 bacterium]